MPADRAREHRGAHQREAGGEQSRLRGDERRRHPRQADALEVYRASPDGDVEWTYVSPAALIEPGARTGKYRVGGDALLVDARGESRISAEDYAVALLDVLERRGHVRERIGVAS